MLEATSTLRLKDPYNPISVSFYLGVGRSFQLPLLLGSSVILIQGFMVGGDLEKVSRLHLINHRVSTYDLSS